MLGLALSAGWQHWQVQRIVDTRTDLVDAVQQTMAGQQMAHTLDSQAQVLALAFEPLAAAPTVAQEAAATIERALPQGQQPSSAEAPKVRAHMARVLREVDRAEDAHRLRQAWRAWLEASARLQQQAVALVAEAHAARGSRVPAAAQAVQRQAEHAGVQAAALLQQLHEQAIVQLARQVQASRWSTALTLLLLLFTVAAMAPALRQLHAQTRRLAQQAAENERLALVAECTANLVFILDRERRIVWINRAFTTVTGHQAAEVIGRRPHEVMLDKDADQVVIEHLRQALKAGQAAQAALLHRTRTGIQYWVSIDVQPLYDLGGELTGFICVGTEITEQVTQQLRSAALLSVLPMAVTVHGPQGEVLQANAAARALLGQQPGDGADVLLQRGPLHEDMRPLQVADLPVQRCLASGKAEQGRLIGVDDGEGGQRWLLVNVEPLRDAFGQAAGVVACYADWTERRQLGEQLRDSARRDPLTRLPNRSVVLERVQHAIEHRQRHPGYGFAVLFMDVDRFKQVNDTLGHAAGDELLCQVALRLEEALRPGDAVARVDSQLRTAARIGGDEFVIVLESIRQADEASTVAERLLQSLAEPYRLGTHVVHVSVSIGIVTAEQAGEDAGAVLRDCDTAMYEAKRAGRGRWVIFDGSMHERVRAALELEGELRQALARDELDVAYQPLIDLRDQRLVGVEALARWRHAERGDISPAAFIPLAEECGLIDTLGAQVLAKACARFAAWQANWGERAPGLLAVNLSRAQLRQPGLVPEVLAVLQSSGMRPEQLQLEVTESFAAQDAQVQAMLRSLKAAGVRLALDDFGTGYSSLACLHQLPVDTVKIDRSFVAHAREVEYHRVLIAATIRVARSLGMATVAEGIETEEQAALMTDLDCDRGQGWLFGRPMKADALELWLEARFEDTLA